MLCHFLVMEKSRKINVEKEGAGGTLDDGGGGTTGAVSCAKR